MGVFGEFLPFFERHFLERAFGVRVEPEKEFGVEVFFEMFQNERLDLVVAAVEIDRREKCLERVGVLAAPFLLLIL